jgi:hypothetical protein
MDAGLGILVRDTGDAARGMSPLHDLLQIFLSPTIFVWRRRYAFDFDSASHHLIS